MQQIISQLITMGSDDKDIHAKSPYLDLRVVPSKETLAGLEVQTHRRFIKMHLPVDALVYSPQAKYLYLARDGRDTMWSMHNHYHKANDTAYTFLNDAPGRVGPRLERPPNDPVQYFRDFLDNDADVTKFHFPFWEHTRGWWEIRDLPNILLVHSNDLKADRKGELRRIAQSLDIDVPEERWDNIMHHTSFEYMKEYAVELTPVGMEVMMEGGARSFINKGTNGRWQGLLSGEEISRYEEKARSELGNECAEWLAHGRGSNSV